METLMTFMLMRLLVTAAVVVGVAVLVAVVVVLAKRSGRLDDVRRAASPLAKGLGTRSGTLGAAGRVAGRYLDRDEQR